MDVSALIELIDSVITKGGHVGVVVMIVFGWQLTRYAAKAIKILGEINSGLTAQRAEFAGVKETLTENTRATDEVMAAVSRIEGMTRKLRTH